MLDFRQRILSTAVIGRNSELVAVRRVLVSVEPVATAGMAVAVGGNEIDDGAVEGDS